MKRLLFAHSIMMVCAGLAATAQAEVRTEYLPGMLLGGGYDAITGELKQQCMKGTESKITLASSRVDFTWDEAISTENLRRMLQVDVAASFNAVAGSGSGKVAFLNSFNSRSSIVSIFAQKRIVSGEQRLVSPTYSSIRPADTFRRDCGTHYLATIVTGGELYALLSQRISSEEERRSFRAHANAKYRTAAEVNTSVSSDTERSTSDSRVQVTGGIAGGSSQDFGTPSELASRFAALRGEVDAGEPYPIEAVYLPYPDLPSEFLNKLDALQEAFERVARLKDFKESAAAVASNPAAYFVVRESLDAGATAIDQKTSKLILAIKRQMRRCSSSATGTELECDFSSYPIPALGTGSGLPPLYRSTCSPPWTPPSYFGEFTVLTHRQGDASMGGDDAVDISTGFTGSKGQPLQQVTTVLAYETSTGNTRFSDEHRRAFFDKGQQAPCLLSANVSLNASGKAPLGRSEHDYRDLPFNTSLVKSAVCRTNQGGQDIGYVGCQTVVFAPIDLPLVHAEDEDGSPIPLKEPSWLASTNAPAFVDSAPSQAKPEQVEPKKSMQFLSVSWLGILVLLALAISGAVVLYLRSRRRA